MVSTTQVPGAKVLTAAQLAAAMSVPILGVTPSAIATLAALAAFLPMLSGGAPAIVALNTVGAGTITAAAIGTKFVQRGGSQSNAAFSDTTATAALIVAALPGAYVGQSFLFYYENTTNASATIVGGTNVTVSGTSVVPSNSVVPFLVTVTALGATPTVSMVGLGATMPTAPSGTYTSLTGGGAVTVADTRVTANSVIIFTLKTLGGTPTAAPYVATITPGTGFTVKGSASGDTSVYNYLILN
jgi:hypothetical protein